MSTPVKKKSKLSLIPGRNLFLRLDNWLRINHPIIWRTKVHYFFVFSFLLLNPLLLFIAYSYPISLESYPVYVQLDLLAAIMMGISF